MNSPTHVTSLPPRFDVNRTLVTKVLPAIIPCAYTRAPLKNSSSANATEKTGAIGDDKNWLGIFARGGLVLIAAAQIYQQKVMALPPLNR
jgi:hypothetical protein